MSKPPAKRLVIVESPGKVKKIQAFLGGEFRVLASIGNVRELPLDALGVDVQADFKPTRESIQSKATIIKRLVKAMNEAEARQTLLYHIAEAAQIPEHQQGDFLFNLEQGERERQPMSAAHWELVDHDLTPNMPDFMDDRQWGDKDKRLSEVFTLTDVHHTPPDLNERLRALGVQVADVDSASTPPPLFDEATNTAYWIGVYQPDPTNHEQAITSLLSLGTDSSVAYLAPIAAGSFEHAYQTAEYLLKVAERTQHAGRVLDAAEGMAVATQHREWWDTPQGIPIEEAMTFNPISLDR